MSLFQKIFRNPRKAIDKLFLFFSPFLSDKLYSKIFFHYSQGYSLNLNNPKTFNEKLQWLKLYDRQDLYTILVDKYLVKDYVKKRIGDEFVIPTLAVWDNVNDINLDDLPNKFVLKTNHSGGNSGVVICKDKNSFDLESAKQKLKLSLNTDFYKVCREWPYKNIKRKIIAEQFIEDFSNESDDLPDYKFFCFDGEPKFCQVIRDRNNNETIDFYDMNWNHLQFIGLNTSVSFGESPVQKPNDLNNIVKICQQLSSNLKFCRVDLTSYKDKLYFVEITLYPAGGFGKFSSDNYNRIIGDYINLKGVCVGGYLCCLNKNNTVTITSINKEDIKDYKFFVFNGVVKFFKIDFNRSIEHHANYYDLNGNLLPFGEYGLEPVPAHIENIPSNFGKMVELAEILSKGLQFARLDFYNVSGKIYFGEITLYPAGGFGKFVPANFDKIIGSFFN